MRMGQGIRTGLGHQGITCVLQTQSPVSYRHNFLVNLRLSQYTKILQNFVVFSVLSVNKLTFLLQKFRLTPGELQFLTRQKPHPGVQPLYLVPQQG